MSHSSTPPVPPVVLMDFRLIGVFESSCPCRDNGWDLETCTEPRFQLLASSMPSTGRGLSDLIKMTQDCSVALQRLEQMVPGFHYSTRSSRTMAGKERLARAAVCTNGTGTATGSDEDWMRDRVQKELRRGRGDKRRIVVRSFGYSVTCKDLKTVLGTNWLNDVVIDFYMALVAARANETPGSLRVHALTTHFFNVLRNRGYDAVRRWTDSVNLFSYDLVFVPIHDQDHWSLAVLNMMHQTFEFYDSMGRKNWKCYQVLMAYLKKEHQDKLKRPLTPDVKWECKSRFATAWLRSTCCRRPESTRQLRRGCAEPTRSCRPRWTPTVPTWPARAREKSFTCNTTLAGSAALKSRHASLASAFLSLTTKAQTIN